VNLLAGWLVYEAACLSFALGLAFNRFQCQIIRQLPIDHHAWCYQCFVFLDTPFSYFFIYFFFYYYQLILCLDSIIEYSSLRDFYRPLCHRGYFYMRIFETWYFGLCWNLGLLVIEL
jgi:hypothetical protein